MSRQSAPDGPESPPLMAPLSARGLDLQAVGGKGLNLLRLSQAGMPVPQGFLLTTDAYRRYVAHNGLQQTIRAAVDSLPMADPVALEARSRAIRDDFSRGSMPEEVTRALSQAYTEMGSPPLAVRSSATAEDLPDLSFAGQQDTFLNVQGFPALQTAVIACWSSLWTARAMAYRERNGISHHQVALAVILQVMVESEASGVLFTANPLTGRRSEAVIDAVFGLGEALVSGQVMPDHYVVDGERGVILSRELGEKALSIRSRPQGGVARQTEQAATRQALPDPVIQDLVALGRQIQDLYAAPQDVEWAWADGELAILQARPITSLYPLPAAEPPAPWGRQGRDVYFSLGAVQGLLDPMTPLGRDVIMAILSGGAALFDLHYTYRTQSIVRVAGERLFVRITPLLGHRLGRALVFRALGVIESGTAQALQEIRAELGPADGQLGPVARQRILRFLRFLVPRLRRALAAPETGRRSAQDFIEKLLADRRRTLDQAGNLAQVVQGMMTDFSGVFPALAPELLPRLAAGMGSLFWTIFLSRRFLGSRLGQDLPEPLEITRGLPHNVTTEMDLVLWTVAEIIARDGESASLFADGSHQRLAEQYLAGELPVPAQAALAAFMDRYGMRGPAEFDIGRPRWRERPGPVIQSIQSYLRITDGDQAPDAVFRRGATVAQESIRQLADAAGNTRFGTFKSRILTFLATRARALSGLRETPKFTVIRLMGLYRRRLLQEGQKLVDRRLLATAEDIFYLHLDELEALGRGETREWRSLIRVRRAALTREQQRRQVPRLLLSDGRAFYDGVRRDDLEGELQLAGTPVSPGIVEGLVRVVFDPHEANLTPGEILVCPGTDPAWTPLFLAAAGLVMEVGGLMTHGSVVAREYGIPAVVGVHRVTERLQTGQRIRVDGNLGRVEILPGTPDPAG